MTGAGVRVAGRTFHGGLDALRVELRRNELPRPLNEVEEV